MIRPQFWQVIRRRECGKWALAHPSRQFSVSRAIGEEGQSLPSDPNAPKNGVSSTPSRTPQTLTRTTGAKSQIRGRPAKAIDARSFAAPRAGGEQPRVIRNIRLRNVRSGNQAQGRRPKAAASKANKKPQKGARSRRFKKADVDDGEDLSAAAIDQVEQEQVLKARPAPVRYDPKIIDFTTLQQTWPSLPTDANARAVSILEKLSKLSSRYPNGYIPPFELGRRLWKGHNVLFENEAEKAEAMKEVERLCQARADKISQRKGDVVEPRKVKFSAINAADTKVLLESFAQGRYPTLEAQKDQPTVLGDVLRNLRNNATYQTSGKRLQFLGKVESLLISSRVKRT